MGPRVIAAVLAGGVGARMGASFPKQLLPLEGRPIIEHTVAAFEACPDVDEVVVLMVAEHVGRVEDIVAEAGFTKVSRVLPGGATRTDTSCAALAAMEGAADTDIALLHDAARPLVRPATISACVSALAEANAVGVAVPSSDTVVRVAPGRGGEAIAEVPPRSQLRRMQTPQGFRLGTVRRAYELATADPDLVATDDCGVVLRYLPEEEVRIVPGEETNIKVTNPGDVELAETLLRRLRNASVPDGGRA
ncbi:IspD/TarI family cytidylyltransferase [Nocardiopsis algeriensis]|uniref:2-C-methyl-D-erythritol 4-phosphate cytidylyltransferase n=1 Tax=Nocardiopsis algeriensis TaxID=1478215 RepID=A0A841IRD4_9ACTN|nr:IspD/TarI family cytidylyltransferase [Nocardiopsis algeriensis]MBB6118861.1 2-C-methyl-D-erythritol 4-phosphate cytidylyltransferase [Nocardiopsis algeriensis]